MTLYIDRRGTGQGKTFWLAQEALKDDGEGRVILTANNSNLRDIEEELFKALGITKPYTPEGRAEALMSHGVFIATPKSWGVYVNKSTKWIMPEEVEDGIRTVVVNSYIYQPITEVVFGKPRGRTSKRGLWCIGRIKQAKHLYVDEAHKSLTIGQGGVIPMRFTKIVGGERNTNLNKPTKPEEDNVVGIASEQGTALVNFHRPLLINDTGEIPSWGDGIVIRGAEYRYLRGEDGLASKDNRLVVSAAGVAPSPVVKIFSVTGKYDGEKEWANPESYSSTFKEEVDKSKAWEIPEYGFIETNSALMMEVQERRSTNDKHIYMLSATLPTEIAAQATDLKLPAYKEGQPVLKVCKLEGKLKLPPADVSKQTLWVCGTQKAAQEKARENGWTYISADFCETELALAPETPLVSYFNNPLGTGSNIFKAVRKLIWEVGKVSLPPAAPTVQETITRRVLFFARYLPATLLKDICRAGGEVSQAAWDGYKTAATHQWFGRLMRGGGVKTVHLFPHMEDAISSGVRNFLYSINNS